MFRRRPDRKGFTMIELMVVVVIVGILAAIAIPIYGKYIKNSRVTEATGRIGEIITAAKAYAQEHPDANGNPTWPPAAGGGIMGDATNASFHTENFTYVMSGGVGQNANTNNFIVTATGRLKMAGVTVTVTVPNIMVNGNPPDVQGL